METAEPLTIDFSTTFASTEVITHQPRAEFPRAQALALGMTDEQIAATRATYVSNGGNVSETARYHDMTPQMVTKLAHELAWPVYATETVDKSHRQHMRKVMNKLEVQMVELADSLTVERKLKEETATMSKRELSTFLEPLSSRHSAFKTVFDAWMRLGAMLYPEDFARDPDPSNWRAAEERSQVRDLALLGGIAGIKRSMEDIFARNFVVGVPDRDRPDADDQIEDAEVIDGDD